MTETTANQAGGGIGDSSQRPSHRDDFAWDRERSSSLKRSSVPESSLSADLAELRAKYEQRRASEYDSASTVITATQIASMLEGDVQTKAFEGPAVAVKGGGAKGLPGFVAVWKQRLSNRFVRPWRLFIAQGYTLEANTPVVVTWDLLLCACALFNAIWVPLALAMPAARWDTDFLLDGLLDAIFVLDVCFRFRVSFRDHGSRASRPTRNARIIHPGA
jgi:hypothetical protein